MIRDKLEGRFDQIAKLPGSSLVYVFVVSQFLMSI